MDAADPQRFEESKKALEDVLAEGHLHDRAVLVLANKQVGSWSGNWRLPHALGTTSRVIPYFPFGGMSSRSHNKLGYGRGFCCRTSPLPRRRQMWPSL